MVSLLRYTYDHHDSYPPELAFSRAHTSGRGVGCGGGQLGIDRRPGRGRLRAREPARHGAGAAGPDPTGAFLERPVFSVGTRRGPGSEGDRKSTRLNSSHTVISYAVFCLKKKNETCTRL